MARILALDIGTSSIRATIYNDRLRPVRAAAHVRYAWHAAIDGSVELPAARLERIVSTAIDGALEGLRGGVDAVAAAAFWHSLVGVDAAGRAVTPVLPWSDTRASAEATALRQELDEARVHARTGCRLHPTYWPARLRWFKRHDPRAFARVARWMSFPAYLERRWLGRDGESVSQASGTGMLASPPAAWDAALCRACDVDPRQLGSIVDLDSRDGALESRAAQRWPALARARWVPAAGDGGLNNVGAGCVDGARAALMIGTSGALRLAWAADALPVLPPALWRYWIDRRRVVIGGALSNGGNLVAWMRDTLDVTIDGRLDARLARMPPDSHGLTLLPFLAGERSPDYRPDARGAIVGLRLATSREEIVRAGLEAIAYRFLAVFNALANVRQVGQVVATGTALTSSNVWLQIVADVLGRLVALPKEQELTGRGAAVIALEQLGAATGIAAPPIARTFNPDPHATAIYRAAAERQQDLIGRLDRSQAGATIPNAQLPH